MLVLNEAARDWLMDKWWARRPVHYVFELYSKKIWGRKEAYESRNRVQVVENL